MCVDDIAGRWSASWTCGFRVAVTASAFGRGGESRRNRVWISWTALSLEVRRWVGRCWRVTRRRKCGSGEMLSVGGRIGLRILYVPG
jgi:hypothetical protein